MSVEVRPISSFDKMEFRGPGTLKISQGEKESLKIHAPGYVMNDIIADVVDGRLHLGYQSPRIVSFKVYTEVISYDLTVKDLKQLSVTGSGKVIAPDVDVDSLDVKSSGSGKIYLQHLTADHFRLRVSGSGMVSVAGDVESQIVKITGSGAYLAEHLVSDFAEVELTGSGKADVSVSDQLSARITGSGLVSYAGYPEVTKQVTGSGSLVRRRRQKKTMDRGEEEHG